MNTPDNSAQAPLHIALVTETYLPEVNGVAITIGRMVEGLIGRGHHIHLIRPRQHKQDTPQHSDRFEETLFAGMPIPGYPELKTGFPAKSRLLRLWQRQRPDIVHIATEGALGWSACSAARKLGIPVSTDFHTNFHNYSKHYGVGWLSKPVAAYLRYFHNRADCTLVPTIDLQQELSHAKYRDVLVVSRGVDAELFHPKKRSDELRRAWGATDETPVAIVVSRIAAEKNLPVAIHAFEQMRASRPDAKLVMVGDGPARAALQKQHPQVIFTGMRTGEDLAAHYASGDIFLYPSLTETYGNVTVEAMASGLATIAYDYAAARQHIRHEKNGLLAAFDDTAAFTAQAAGLVDDAARIGRLRIRARQTAELLAWDHIMAEMETALLDVARKERSQNADAEISTANYPTW